MQDEPLELPPGYVLDASDPDVLVSRCSGGFVGGSLQRP
jgi:hypothetical protein